MIPKKPHTTLNIKSSSESFDTLSFNLLIGFLKLHGEVDSVRMFRGKNKANGHGGEISPSNWD